MDDGKEQRRGEHEIYARVYLITFNKYQDDISRGGREDERLFTDANSLPVGE